MRLWTFTLIALFVCVSAPAGALLWPSAVLRVERDLRSQDLAVRRRAAQALRDLPPSSGVRLSRAALDDADIDVRLAALDAALSLRLPGLGERLVPWLGEGERRLRLAAAEALADSPSPRAVPSLGRALGDTDPAVRGAAALALGQSGSADAALALLGHLDDSAPEVRRDVALALGDLADVRAVVPLIGKIQDPRPIVRAAVAEALAQLADGRATSALVLSLRDSDDSVRIAALSALGRIADPSAVQSISALLSAASDPVQAAALDALSLFGTPAASKALIDELRGDRASAAHSRAVSALGRSGAFALPALLACLNAESDPDVLGGCALAAGQTHEVAGARAIEEALRRGTLPPLPALLALADLRAPDSLSTVLEYFSDPDLQARKAARLAAAALLDPRRPDGRVLEPIVHALGEPYRERDEQIELIDLLGQSGSARAALNLLPYASAGDDIAIRSHALSALGFLGEAAQAPTLLHALDDDSGSVRLAAALALGRLDLAQSAQPLLDRLEHANSEERPLLALALGQTLSHSRDPSVAARLFALLRVARGGERDQMIELCGRMPLSAVSAELDRLSREPRAAADRAKFAESLAGHPEERARLGALLRDPSSPVRANAAWSLAEVGTASDRDVLKVALGDEHADVAGNALQALARIAVRAHEPVAPEACPRLLDVRATLRGLALRALRFAGERCEHGEERAVLRRDRSEFVRQAAAALLRDVPRDHLDALALARARARDPSSRVAAESEEPSPPRPDGVEATAVVIIAAGEDVPRPSQPFALLRADGLLRLGVSDRRGQLFEVAAPRGRLSLAEPAADFE